MHLYELFGSKDLYMVAQIAFAIKAIHTIFQLLVECLLLIVEEILLTNMFAKYLRKEQR